MIKIKEHIDMLGMTAKDQVTGLRGIVTSITFDLYGCIQALVHPGLDADGKPKEQIWLDINRLICEDCDRAMPMPTFDWSDEKIASGAKGPAEKPNIGKF